MQVNKAKAKHEKFKKEIRAGEWHRVHDKRTNGHKSLVTEVEKGGVVKHIPITHSPKTRHQNNIKLQENPQKGKNEDTYLIPKVQKTDAKCVDKKVLNMQVKNATDKSVIRHIKNKNRQGK